MAVKNSADYDVKRHVQYNYPLNNPSEFADLV